MNALDMQADIIAVGSELLTPSRAETNSLFITGQLNALGITVGRKVVVGDSEEKITDAFRTALGESRLVFLTGGLGPTNDDLTRESVAAALGLPLLQHAPSMARLESLYARFGVTMTDNNRRQALVPEGAEVLENANGTAPGLFLRVADRLVFLLPGPPRELYPMMENQVIPLIRNQVPTRQRHTRHLRVASLAESLVDSRIEAHYKSFKSIETTILSSSGIIEVLLTWTGPDEAETANLQLDQLAARIRGELGENVFAEGTEDLEAVVGRLLAARRLRLATAESCTGGWIGKMLTDVAGSSAYFLGGVVSYANQVKSGVLGVSEDTLLRRGAVSQEAAMEMAEGVRRLTGADIGLAVTGVAGPDGGTDEKPVGLVFFGLAREGQSQFKKRQIPGDREAIRLRSARFALDWLRRELL